VGVYNLEADVHQMALNYLHIVLIGLPGYFLTLAMSGIYNAHGRSMIPFKINSLGLLLNMILDPLLIFVFHLGVVGAAFATLLSQLAVCAILYYRMQHRDKILDGSSIVIKLAGEQSRRIFAIGVPVVLLNSLFALISIFMGRLASEQGGAIGVAVMTTGGQLEGVTWNACQGFCTALATFVGHNYAARQFDRVWRGYKTTILMTLSIGLFGTLLFLFLGEAFFALIVPDPETYIEGGRYLYIASFSQLFIMAEITTQGLFYGVGRSNTPAIISIVGNLLRIPLALLLIYLGWGLPAVWWAISLSSIGKGITAIIVLLIKRNKLTPTSLVA
jgi:Na+-driven multidrug efflux pump